MALARLALKNLQNNVSAPLSSSASLFPAQKHRLASPFLRRISSTVEEKSGGGTEVVVTEGSDKKSNKLFPRRKTRRGLWRRNNNWLCLMAGLAQRLFRARINGIGEIGSIPRTQISSFHSGQPSLAPRSFFGVEDFLDDDNSRPYTYQKEKKSKNTHKHASFKQRTEAFMEPFTLDVFISKRFVSASITHRVTCKQVAVAGTNSKDVKAALQSRSDIPACLSVGRILADRAREADVYTACYTPRERDKFEGKIRAVVQSLIDSGIDIKVYLD